MLVVSATHRDHRELKRLNPSGVDFRFHDYASTSLEELISGIEREGAQAGDPDEEVDRILKGLGGSEDQRGHQHRRLSGRGACRDHRQAARAARARSTRRADLPAQISIAGGASGLVPDAVPPFMLIDTAEGAPLPDDASFPLFVKPVKSFFSVGAERVASRAELAALLPRWRALDQFFLPLERMLERYAGETIGSKRLIAEGVLKGVQVTVEGYAFGGKASVMGIVDSIMFPGTIAFSRFDYPSRLPEDVQAHMTDIAVTLMEGLGFDNGLFNIEMMYDADTGRIFIIEINPRMASQFADLYEKVDGTSSYQVLLDIARGAGARASRADRAAIPSPRAACCVPSPTIASRSYPMRAICERLEKLYPDSRIEIHARRARSCRTSCMTDRATATASSISAGAISPTCSRHSSGTGVRRSLGLSSSLPHRSRDTPGRSVALDGIVAIQPLNGATRA